MKIGVFADTHDHLDNIRRAVVRFNAEQVDVVLFAGDLVSTFAVPPLRKLNCPFIGCYGDNEGNRPGLQAGMSIIGILGEPPFCYRAGDGTRILLTHARAWAAGFEGDFDVMVYAHTHRARIHRDDRGRLFVNPGEASGWSNGIPTIALMDTTTRTAEIVSLLDAPFSPRQCGVCGAWSDAAHATGKCSESHEATE